MTLAKQTRPGQQDRATTPILRAPRTCKLSRLHPESHHVLSSAALKSVNLKSGALSEHEFVNHDMRYMSLSGAMTSWQGRVA